eukprot:g18399.t1
MGSRIELEDAPPQFGHPINLKLGCPGYQVLLVMLLLVALSLQVQPVLLSVMVLPVVGVLPVELLLLVLLVLLLVVLLRSMKKIRDSLAGSTVEEQCRGVVSALHTPCKTLCWFPQNNRQSTTAQYMQGRKDSCENEFGRRRSASAFQVPSTMAADDVLRFRGRAFRAEHPVGSVCSEFLPPLRSHIACNLHHLPHCELVGLMILLLVLHHLPHGLLVVLLVLVLVLVLSLVLLSLPLVLLLESLVARLLLPVLLVLLLPVLLVLLRPLLAELFPASGTLASSLPLRAAIIYQVECNLRMYVQTSKRTQQYNQLGLVHLSGVMNSAANTTPCYTVALGFKCNSKIPVHF